MRKARIHQYQYVVKGKAGSIPFQFEVLASNENQASEFARDQMTDWSTGNERIESVARTGYVLVLEADLR